MTVTVDTAREAPFLGLRYFDEEHSHLFFGRDPQVNDLLEKLRLSRLVTVMGSSGSGKSSLVRSGVIPRLKAGLLAEAGPRWRVAKMRPGNSPIASLASDLEKALSVGGLDVTLRRGPLGLVQTVAECRLPPTENVLVIADQFEELFRYQRESSQPDRAKEDAAAFVKLLLEATAQQAIPIYVVVTMRSDYLGNCAQFRDLPERINEGLYLVPRMRRDQLEQAITGPVAVEDADIAPRLVQRLLNDTGDDPDQLPVLQHALLRAWSTWNHSARPLDLEDLDAVGGMKDCLSRHANEIFEGLSREQQRIARVLFQQLSERDAEGREIRRPAPASRVAAVAGTTEQAVKEVVEKFAAPDAALLYRNEDGHLDITHESLIRKWHRIQGRNQAGGAEAKGWMQEEVEARDEFRVLVERAAKKDTLRGPALDAAVRWRALGLTADWARRYMKAGAVESSFPKVLDFIEESHKEEISRRRRRTSIVIGVPMALAVFLLVIAFLWMSATRQKRVAEEATHRAGTALAQLSTQEATRLFAEDQVGSALAHLARALRSAPDDIAARSWVSDLIPRGGLWVPGAALQHEGRVSTAAFSPDGRRVVTASDDYTARIWDAGTGLAVAPPLRHQDRVRTAVFSPDGRRVVTASRDFTARVWDAVTGQPIGEPLQHGNDVESAAFSPDGRLIVTASADRTARMWDADTGRPAGAPLRHEKWVYAAAFSPDGRRIATASGDKTARIWDAATGLPIIAPIRHDDMVVSVAFAPDSRRIVTTSFEKTARIWDADTGHPIGAPLQHKSMVREATFSPDGRRIVTVSDNTPWIWDAATGVVIARLLGHRADALSATFSSDSRRVVSTSADQTARVWDSATGQPIGSPLQHLDRVRYAAFSPDGRHVITASLDNTARIWAAPSGQPTVMPMTHSGPIRSAVFSRDGRRIVTASSDKTAQVWDVATARPLGAPVQHQDDVHLVGFSPNGRHFVTASTEMARVWDATSSQPLGAPLAYKDGVNSVTFSPDGQVIAITSGDRTGRVWNVATGQLVCVLRGAASADFSADGRHIVTVSDHAARVWAANGQSVAPPLQHRARVTAAAFSPDGRRVITASHDNTARVWDAATGQPVGAVLQHQSGVNAAAFSLDGRRIITASLDGTARVWDAATRQPVGAPLLHRGPVDTAAFSSDGRRIVTVSENAVRAWDAVTGLPLGAPFQHQDSVRSAAFSSDGRRIVTVTGAYNDVARASEWVVLLGSGSAEEAEQLADVAEVGGGYRLSEFGSLVPLDEPERLQRVRRLIGPEAHGFVPLEVLLRRFLPAPR